MGTRLEIGVPVAVVDYYMWDLRYWLPWRATFAHYITSGDQWDAEDSERVTVRGFHDWDFEIETGLDGVPRIHRIPRGRPAELVESWREEGDTVVVKDGSQPDSGTVVIVARDWRALSANDDLPPSIWEDREDGLYGSMVDEAGEVLDSIGMARRRRRPGRRRDGS